jgi:hypothetical protein
MTGDDWIASPSAREGDGFRGVYCRSLVEKPNKEVEYNGEHNADDDRGDNRKVERKTGPLYAQVTGKPTEWQAGLSEKPYEHAKTSDRQTGEDNPLSDSGEIHEPPCALLQRLRHPAR